ncbi:MAG TPA: RDD family protein [Steroidobacteraceae bacterium]|nr:RDD family protein [Steroidobacteraceae bacterium]
MPTNNALPNASSAAAPADSGPRASSDVERLRIAGLTGVDLGLEIAGPGSRSYAFIVDWHIRVLLALAWFGTVVFLNRTGVWPGVRIAYLGGLPALAIYLLYQPLIELVMRGRTPGKRQAGVRLVTRSGGTPGIAALLIRNVFRLIDMLPGFYVLGLVCCFVTRERVRIGDLAAGTLLVVDDIQRRLPTSALAAVAHGTLTPPVAELIEDLLERWDTLDPQHRITLARGVLAGIGAPAAERAHSARSESQRLREQLRGLLAQRSTP